MLSRVPYRLGAQLEVVDLTAGVPWGDGVDDLPVGESVSVPMEMGLQIIWALVMREPTINDKPAASAL